MATAQDLIQMALRRIKIVSRDEAMQADDADHALSALNLMLHGWKARGADITHTDYDLDTTVAVSEELHDGIVQLLAMRLSTDFAVPPPTADGFDYDNWWRAVLNAYLPDTDLTVDRALFWLPSQRNGLRYGND